MKYLSMLAFVAVCCWGPIMIAIRSATLPDAVFLRTVIGAIGVWLIATWVSKRSAELWFWKGLAVSMTLVAVLGMMPRLTDMGRGSHSSLAFVAAAFGLTGLVAWLASVAMGGKLVMVTRE